jgi:hypothetical protein
MSSVDATVMSPMEHPTLLRLEEGRPHPSAQSSAMASIYQGTDSALALLQFSNRNMATPDIVLQEGWSPNSAAFVTFADSRQVYKSARDIAKVERPLSMPAVQPLNFGLVVPGVYRSSYPQAQDYDYLRGLKLKTIVYVTTSMHHSRGMEIC